MYSAAQPQVPTIGPNDGNLDANTPALPTPQPLHMIDITNERPSPIAENIAESSFTEPAASIEHCIRLVEDIELLTDGNGKIVSKGEVVVWFMQGQR